MVLAQSGPGPTGFGPWIFEFESLVGKIVELESIKLENLKFKSF